LKPIAIAIVGGKKSGKTTTIELLIRELTKRGYRVAAVKHIPEPNFTIDKEGKDTWRFAKAGAETVVSVAEDEIAKIEKVNTENISVEQILQICSNNDIVFLEGFRKLVAQEKDVIKIVVVKSRTEALDASKKFSPILAFTGSFSTHNLNLKVPYVNITKNPNKLADFVENVARKRV
jgi:molybdopterin-guanine dinucleotide biosynthesis protein B